ncbi:hypothetical protein PUN28_001355 [Cardiocondyla obscurior]|uniref:Uncharacterized protein n=1 Tax=Cardiocondyla obscurior TaxID=286306 RepID=A0AAW2H526_9HYME
MRMIISNPQVIYQNTDKFVIALKFLDFNYINNILNIYLKMPLVVYSKKK